MKPLIISAVRVRVEGGGDKEKGNPFDKIK